MIYEKGGIENVTSSSKAPGGSEAFSEKLKIVEAIVVEVINGKDIHFEVLGSERHRARMHKTLTGKMLLGSLMELQECEELICRNKRWIEANPYLDLYFKSAVPLDFYTDWSVVKGSLDDVSRSVSMLNNIVESMRRGAASHDFKEREKRLIRAEKKRVESLEKYINALYSFRARLLVIRLDLSYRDGMYIDSEDFYGDFLKAKGDWQKFRYDLKRGLPIKGALGFATKMEYGLLSGFHFHSLLFFDGALSRQDVVIGNLMGEHWVRGITGGEGRYYNCNRDLKDYRFPGIGMVSHGDDEKVSSLMTIVTGYLAKPDHFLEANAPGARTFFRGDKPKVPKVAMGRPRRRDAASVCAFDEVF